MNENEIRLNAENIRLFEENIFLKDLLNRLIPIPKDDVLDRIDYRLNELEKRMKKIEGIGNKANI